MMRLRNMGWLLVLAGLLAVGPLQAAPVYQYQYVFDQSTYMVAAGGTVSVNVYLLETPPPGDPSMLATYGLTGAGVMVDNVGTLPSQPATVSTITPNPAFSQLGSPFQPSPNGSSSYSAGILELAPFDSNSNIVPVTAGPNAPYEILLGTFLYQAGSVPGETTEIEASDININYPDPTQSANNVLDDPNNTVLDGSISSGFATIQVEGTPPPAVPEPATVTLALFGLAGLAGRRYLLGKS